MWLMTFVAISALITVGITTNFYVNTAVSGCNSPVFHRYHGNALVNHVIKTLPLFIADCMTACQETLSCFSINSYNNGFMCDLNRSTKKKSPGSFVRMTGYEYAEAEKMMYCKKDECSEKEVLLDGWYRLNSSKFKFISEKKNWQDAKNHCVTLGGDLASFANQLENSFAVMTMNMTSAGNTTTASGGGDFGSALVNLKMDGTDPSQALSLHGAIVVEDIDGGKAIEFDGSNDYATIPRFDIQGDLTIALWLKARTSGNMYILSDQASSPNQISFRIYISLGKMNFYLNKDYTTWIVRLKSLSDLQVGVWVHVAVTWERNKKEAKMFFDAKPNGAVTSTLDDVTPYTTTLQNFELAAFDSGRRNRFSGWMKGLSVIAKALTQEDIAALKDNSNVNGKTEGIWVGLNDLTKEGEFQWSDGTPLTHNKIVSSDNNNDNDCVRIPKDGDDESNKWMIAKCSEESSFLCKKM